MQQNVQDLFVPLEIALKLKEKGFDDKCIAVFIKDGEIEHADVLPNLYFNVRDGYKFYITTCFIHRNHKRNCVSAPTWEQATEWLLSKNLVVADLSLYREQRKLDTHSMIDITDL